jgi:hypothetical protein
MGAIGNYEVVTEDYDLTLPGSGQTVVVSVPVGKVALGWGSQKVSVIDSSGNVIAGLLDKALIVEAFPEPDGSAVTFQFTGGLSAPSGTRDTGTLYVTCAEMGC